MYSLGEQGFLPQYMVLGKKSGGGYVYIKPGVIEHIRKKTGIEIAGGLSNLARRLGYKYEPIRNIGKCMKIPLDELASRLVQTFEEEEEGEDIETEKTKATSDG